MGTIGRVLAVTGLLLTVGCTSLLGIDEDYTPLPDGGAGTTSTTSTAGTTTGGTTTASGGAGGAGGGTAAGALPQGSACDDGSQCESTFCSDGVCCDEACDGECEACTAATTGGDDGACTPYAAYDDPEAECGTDMACDGEGLCKNVDGADCNGGGNCISANCQDGTCEP